ncbi:MAG: VCBS repeat-containing protein [Balneolaceae bacterium]|nr:VCBS repeat-containing protein [Balneolaceae bacterium]MBO6544935.1 VCBS repeat-containing protein [Balneolaceae bacterium]MBO6646331.1 VCBS repeat-containing protein [Balneolaceae bacterium]
MGYYRLNQLYKALFTLTFLLIFSGTTNLNAQVVAGIDTLNKVSGQWEYYDFTSQKAFSIADTATYTPDFWGSSNEGVNFGKEFSSLIPGKRLYLLGTGDIDTVKTVPEWTDDAPWIDTSWDWPNGTQGQPISPDQLWVVYTSEGLYAVMQIDELPGGDFGNSFVFKYKYMSEGGTSLTETNLNEDNGSQIAGSGTSTFGTGFDFSGEETADNEDAGDYQLDFAFVSNEGVNFGNEGSSSLSSTGRRFLLLGTGNIDTLKSVPSRTDAAPWVTVSYDFSDGTQGQPISVGQLWGVFTREGHYAVMEITDLPDGNFGNSFTFDYKYQPNGTRFFEGSDGVEPDPVLSIAIEEGDNQTVLPEAVAPEFLRVLITDENANLISDATVTFNFSEVPDDILVAGSLATSAQSNESGIAQSFVKAGDAPGVYKIKATLDSDTSKYVTFTLNVEDTSSTSAEQLTGSTTSTLGTGFDFSREETGDNNDTGDYQLDFAFVSNEGVNFGNEGSSSLSGTGRRFLLLGTGDIDTVKSVPERVDTAPWVTVSYDFSDGTVGLPIAVGQLWAVYTREGHYAIMEITDLPGGNFGTSFSFDYIYQPNGTRFFEGSGTVDPDPVYNLAIVSGNNQQVALNTFAPESLIVKLTDENGDAIAEKGITFSFSNIPDGATGQGGLEGDLTTDINGEVSTPVKIGDSNGQYFVKAQMDVDAEVSVEFTLIGVEAQPASIEIASGDNQSAFPTEPIEHPLKVIVKDASGNPITSGAGVDFEVTQHPDAANPGNFTSIDGIQISYAGTDSEGIAQIKYFVGTKPGTYVVKASVSDYGSIDPVFFTVNGAELEAPLNLKASSGAGSVKLTWNKAAGASAYNIYRSQGDDNPASASFLNITDDTMFVDVNVTSGEGYFYWVTSIDHQLNESEDRVGPAFATPTDIPIPVSGEATIVAIAGDGFGKQWQYFDFSKELASSEADTGAYFADIRGTSNEGVNFGNESAPQIEGRRIIRLEDGSLEDVTSIPLWTNEEPWISVSWMGSGTSGQPVAAGQLWGVYTREGNYAVMQITDVPEAFGDTLSFRYKYQTGGTPIFSEGGTSSDPDTMVAVMGNNQKGLPGKLLEDPLAVLVVDEDTNGVAGVTVHFDITSVPDASTGALLTSTSAITNEDGLAFSFFTLGDAAGSYEVTASADGVNDVIFANIAEEAQPPQPVTLLEIRDRSSEALSLVWTQSKDPDFLRYRIYMSTDSENFALVDSTRRDGFAVDSGQTVTGLTELVNYSFKVTVVNNNFVESEFSNVLTSFPKPTPDQPQNVMAVAADGAVQINWDAVDSTFFDFYYVYYGEDGFGINMADTVYGYENTSTVISGLENETTYQFYVFAVNRFGVQSAFPDKILATPQSTYEEQEITLPDLINGVSSWADVDNDGDLDLLLTGQEQADGDPLTLLYVNDGDGNLSDSGESLEGVINSDVYWFDIDQNEFVDLIISGESSEGPITKVYLNNEGSLTDAGFTLPGLGDGMVSPSDYDNDGDIDFLVAGATAEGPQTLLIKNNGAGSFEPIAFPFTGFTKAAAAWGDSNGDGRIDLLISGEVSDGSIITMLYRYLGNDQFFLAESSFQGVINGTLAFTDFDLDTDQDVLITGYTDAAQTNLFTGFYQNNGLDFELFFSSNSNPPAKAVAAGQAKSRAVVGDYDNDGDPDVLLNANGGASIFNNNRGKIAEEKLDISGAGSVTWADYDGDGDLDIIITGSGSKVLSNTTAIKNTAPSVPENLMFEVADDTVKLSWNPSSDAQTPSPSLTYNVRIGTSAGASDILSANADLSTGKLKILANGNAGYKTGLLLQGLPNGTYFWQVQAVDNSFLGSPFSAEAQFEVMTSLVSNEVIEDLPTKVALEQNYPNPFNPSTTISYSVPKEADVSLLVFDITGRLVGTLVQQRKTAGNHTIAFDAQNLSSGVYIYRLQIGNQLITKKMTLIK